MSRRTVMVIVALSAIVFLGVAPVAGQQKPAAPTKAATLDTVAGKYTGTAATPEGEASVSCEIAVKGSAVTGSLTAGQYFVQITSGALDGEKLTLSGDVGGQGITFTGTFKNGTVEGAWTTGSESGPFRLTKATGEAAAPTATAPPATAPAAGDPLTGDWDGLVDAPEQQRAFSLKLKLDGDKVSGEISSEMGSVALQSGSWVDNKLTVSFPFPTGDAITMTAVLQEGKLVGSMDIGGQMQMAWGAVRRKQ
jgi:hypothetical protein